MDHTIHTKKILHYEMDIAHCLGYMHYTNPDILINSHSADAQRYTPRTRIFR